MRERCFAVARLGKRPTDRIRTNPQIRSRLIDIEMRWPIVLPGPVVPKIILPSARRLRSGRSVARWKSGYACGQAWRLLLDKRCCADLLHAEIIVSSGYWQQAPGYAESRGAEIRRSPYTASYQSDAASASSERENFELRSAAPFSVPTGGWMGAATGVGRIWKYLMPSSWVTPRPRYELCRV